MAFRSPRLAAALRRHVASLATVLTVLLVLGASSAASAAVTCTVTNPALTFGTINPYSGFPYSTSGNGGYSCTNNGTTAVTVYACTSIGTGSGGTSPGNRTLASGASRIPIQITGGPDYPSQIGDGTAYPMAGPQALSIGAQATASGAGPLAATMPAPGSAPPPGTYTSTFSGTDAQFHYAALASAPASCAALVSGAHQTTQANFSISATVPTQCTVSATSLAFPMASVLNNLASATATVSVTCNISISVAVGLDNGATGTAPASRLMKSGANAITYGIYRDAAATLPWENTAGTNTASLASGTGTLTAYGRVPPQASPPPGSYSDVVNVIITY